MNCGGNKNGQAMVTCGQQHGEKSGLGPALGRGIMNKDFLWTDGMRTSADGATCDLSSGKKTNALRREREAAGTLHANCREPFHPPGGFARRHAHLVPGRA